MAIPIAKFLSMRIRQIFLKNVCSVIEEGRNLKNILSFLFSCPFLYVRQNCQHRESGSSIGINPRDIFAVIHMPGRKESDVSFKSAEKLDLFWTPYEEEKDQSHWEKLS